MEPTQNIQFGYIIPNAQTRYALRVVVPQRAHITQLNPLGWWETKITYTVQNISTTVCNTGSAYRFGFNGQEKDNEIKGEGNSIEFMYRIYDSRLGKFLSVDPLAPKYPHNSPYAFRENRVNDCIELEGAESLNIHVRSFIKAKYTYDPLFRKYDGDDRPATTNENVNARGRAKIKYDYKKHKVELNDNDVYANSTNRYNIDGSEERKIAHVNGVVRDKDIAQNIKAIGLHYETKNPLTPQSLTPTVDVDALFIIKYNESEKLWSINYNAMGDGYPLTEAFIEAPSGNRIMLDFKYEVGTPSKKLYGKSEETLFKGTIFVQLDKDLNFKEAYRFDGDKKIKLGY